MFVHLIKFMKSVSRFSHSVVSALRPHRTAFELPYRYVSGRIDSHAHWWVIPSTIYFLSWSYLLYTIFIFSLEGSFQPKSVHFAGIRWQSIGASKQASVHFNECWLVRFQINGWSTYCPLAELLYGVIYNQNSKKKTNQSKRRQFGIAKNKAL